MASLPYAEGPLAFTTSHAAVPATLFASITIVTACAVQPVCVALSLVGALSFSVLVGGVGRALAQLRWQVPILALVCLANPLFSASGSTLLLKLGPISVYLESLAYGACMGVLMVATVVWLENAARVLTQDRVLALMGTRARSVPLVVSMAAQLVPQLLRRARTIRGVDRAFTARGERRGLCAGLVRASGMLLSWALEDSLDRADAMRARGWESGGARTRYRIERFSAADAGAMVLVLVLALVAGLLAWVACAQWRFYPTMPRLLAWWGYLPIAALELLPCGAELLARWRERRLA